MHCGHQTDSYALLSLHVYTYTTCLEVRYAQTQAHHADATNTNRLFLSAAATSALDAVSGCGRTDTAAMSRGSSAGNIFNPQAIKPVADGKCLSLITNTMQFHTRQLVKP